MSIQKTIQNQKGFSLIELMIVVVVLGILASVAVPNYQRFQARSRQSSAKTLLSGYLTSQKATDAEYAYYAGNFVGAGFIPEGSLGFRLTAADNPDVLGGPTTNPVDLFPGCDATSVVPNAANCSALYDSRWVESTYAQIAPVGHGRGGYAVEALEHHGLALGHVLLQQLRKCGLGKRGISCDAVLVHRPRQGGVLLDGEEPAG